jgi:signal transduction histidine kinase
MLVRFGLEADGSTLHFERFGEVKRELAKAVRVEPEGAVEGVPGYRPPAGFELVVADSGGGAILSTSPRFAAGAKIDLAAASAAAGVEFKQPYFYAEPLSYKEKVVGFYYAWQSASMAPTQFGVSGSLRAAFALLSVVMIFFLLGVLIATSLARAVLNLEKAAGRIAAGDFETKVSRRGIREIRNLAAAMDGMRVKLLGDRDRRARFLAAVSHDLRTPLTSIGGYLEAVEDGLASDPKILERYVGIMRGKTRILEGRIAGLIEFARMETGEWRMGFEATELGPFLEDLCREFREDAALMGRDFAFELAALSGLAVAVDKALLTRAMENIVSNAIRYSPEGGAVSLVARRLDEAGVRGALVIDIDDEGPGISPSERESVFEPFVRGSSSREGEGNGLGLYIALSVIKGHGWDICVDQAPGGGGRFSISIPRSAFERKG